MNKRTRICCAVLAAMLAAMLPIAAQACGPDFPAELLSDRAATLNQLPEGAFDFEARNLVPAPPGLTIVEHADWLWTEQKTTRESIEQAWWGDRYAKIAALRDAASAMAADAASAGLPEEARRYQAGAAAFAQRNFDEAVRRFQAVLALAPAERSHYGIWAQFMLGRIAASHGQAANAVAAFAAVRAQVAQGANDPLGLAATSLGDEARVHLTAGDDVSAIALYAQQTAAGSMFGRSSLLQIARAAIKDAPRLERLVADPLGQRLLTAYLFTRSGELSDESADGASSAVDSTRSQANADEKIGRFLAAVERQGLDKVAGADRVAAVAYRSGKYELAGKLAALGDSGLAFWVRAKLALRAGDANAAAQAYAQASKAFPASEEWGTNSEIGSGYETIKPQCRVEGERGTLALSRGEYIAAMEHLYNAASQYWPDTAYLAERVLSVDELKAFVDTHAPAALATPVRDAEGSGYGIPADSATALRTLLARRLLRAERYDESLRYFDSAGLKKKAQTYVDARRSAMQGDRIERARAWYAAARSARVEGISLIGFELDPDYEIYEGSFDLGTLMDAPNDASATAAGGAPDGTAPAAPRKDIVVPKALSGADEAMRVAASRAEPLQRFHYRYSAVDFAQKSADLLPARTQAFAAVLCHATSWLIDRDPPVADKIYRRYIKQGAHVAWGADFGRVCPEPDFAAAAQRLRAERIAWWKHAVKRNAPYALLGLGLLLVGWVLWRRQRRAARR